MNDIHCLGEEGVDNLNQVQTRQASNSETCQTSAPAISVEARNTGLI